MYNQYMLLQSFKILAFILLVFIFPSSTILAEELPPKPNAPLYLTSVEPKHLNSEYWIRKLPTPDKPLKTAQELNAYNDYLNETIPQRHDIFKMPHERQGKPVKDQIVLEYNTLKGRILLDKNDKRIPKSFFENTVYPRVHFEAIPSKIKVKWGAAIRSTSVRALPTTKKMIEGVGDIEFDQLQFTLIKPWTPVGILHTSGDGKWYYVRAPYTRGWVQAEDIALFKTRGELRKLLKVDPFLVVTGPEVSVYATPSFATEILEASMGTILPYRQKNEGGAVVVIPARMANGRVSIRKGYLKPSSDVSVGFLPFTQRNLIQQAFKLLGARYGWGGQYNGRDCSGFTHDVFLSLGLDMPRNSKEQAKVGKTLGHFEAFQSHSEKAAALRNATPAATLLRMPLHLMLYLGEENGHFYIIHSTWAERITMDKQADLKRRINQVIVSDTSLNGKSYLGSLFDRTVSVNEVV